MTVSKFFFHAQFPLKHVPYLEMRNMDLLEFKSVLCARIVFDMCEHLENTHLPPYVYG